MAIPIPGLDDLYSFVRGEHTFRVPVIRIFGVTEDGESRCLQLLSLWL